MNKQEIVKKINAFYKELREYRDLLSVSRDGLVRIVKNHEEIGTRRSSLNRKYGAIEKYVKKFGNQPMREDVGGGPYPVYEVALSADILQRRGPCIDTALQDLEFIMGKVETISSEEVVEDKRVGAIFTGKNATVIDSKMSGPDGGVIDKGTNTKVIGSEMSVSEKHNKHKEVKPVGRKKIKKAFGKFLNIVVAVLVGLIVIYLAFVFGWST